MRFCGALIGGYRVDCEVSHNGRRPFSVLDIVYLFVETLHSKLFVVVSDSVEERM